MKNKSKILVKSLDVFVNHKELILKQWLTYNTPKEILNLHEIDTHYFRKKYASGVFDYFMGVISGSVEIGNCPVMKELLAYLKTREISADELFEICSHFRRSMVDFSYDMNLNSKDLFDEISYIFDKNFKGILQYYTNTIFQKLVDARQDAINASKAKEYFLSNMSHEIRTPLNAILGFLDILLYDNISQKHRNYLDIIKNSGENLLTIINDILDFSKLKSGEFTIDKKVFSLHEELTHTIELFVASANAKDITMLSFIDPKIPLELYGDIVRINQILSNLLSNAIKFTPKNGIIQLEAFYKDGLLEMSVQDNGIGIDKDDMKDVFSAFTQVELNINEDIKGTGLGLSICHQLVQKMDGVILLESKISQGSKFNISIPIEKHSESCKIFEDIYEFKKIKIAIYKNDNLSFKHKSFMRYAEIFDMNIFVTATLECDFDVMLFVHEDVDEDFKKAIRKHDKKFMALTNKAYDDYDNLDNIKSMSFPLYCDKMRKSFEELLNGTKSSEYKHKEIQKYKGHILIAEDNEDNQELIKIILSKYGLSFDLAVNGKEALELYKVNEYDLLLIDEQMPIMNGNETVRKIIDYEEERGIIHTPISALTANVIKGAKERGLLSGFDSFLGKPIILKDLERVFSTYLKKDIKLENSIFGLDERKLLDELMLTKNELILLINLFIKKMQITMPQLSEAIYKKDYEKIALLSHSIKGSSSNFRIKIIQEISTKMELMAKSKNKGYDYKKDFKLIKEKIDKIYII